MPLVTALKGFSVGANKPKFAIWYRCRALDLIVQVNPCKN